MITTDINTVKNTLENNEIVAIPTETVYGLAGNAYNESAIKKIFELKKRPFYNPLIVHIKSTEFIHQVACDIPEMAIRLANQFWPGSLTLIVKKQAHIPDLITAGKDTVAVRVPNHPLTLALLEKLDFPLAAPSANPFGSISPTSANHVANYFEDNLEFILDGGECTNGVESTIIGFENNQAVLYRHGSIAIEEIEKITGKISVKSNNNSSPEAPGMLSRHYAPKTTTYLTQNIDELITSFENKKIGLLLFQNKIKNETIIHQEILSDSGNLKEAAKNLYAAMHRLDKKNLDVIIAEKMPDNGLGKTINDRLQRAIKK
ncbi:L-threonylcarbamoyladenylate synthase [Flavobacterium sp. NG2]|uniref:L-threonylcarbamoyladenylate synthase n=1 Tax=Flavobacterium sp. NG2 TaxID=3097547 RepID=UPI002A83A221|nr:L-threonylcarbamoyladenylate synthase [Flavobacterium sp. NG2]WPR70408.1 L-threonylcarbamoyladenylate synthase [Flavobacterium sp. NG2]